ncbi:MAG TPA: hypothetical protein K8V13_08365, partial [Enterobacter roggenkampii]|nr:hypothetical protein [Enterobacter roggenkampii]
TISTPIIPALSFPKNRWISSNKIVSVDHKKTANSNVAVFLSLGIRGPLGRLATFDQGFYLTLIQISGNPLDPL